MPEQFLDLPFPARGVSGEAEYARQPELTAPDSRNVRTEEPVGQMARGGRRMGLVRFIDAKVNGPNLIQHLNVVVDPDERVFPMGPAGGATKDMIVRDGRKRGLSGKLSALPDT